MSNTCNCPTPPGGSITCNPDQLAVCGLVNGQIVSGCFDRPGHASLIADEEERKVVLTNWVLSVVSGIPREDYDPVLPEEYEALKRGEVRAPDGSVVRFTMPDDLNLTKVVTNAPYARSR